MARTRYETVWVGVFGKWMRTGHVKGESAAERDLAEIEQRLEAAHQIVDDGFAIYSKLFDERAATRNAQKRQRLTREMAKLNRHRRKVVENIKHLQGLREELKTRVSGEAAQRRAEFLRQLTATPEYQRARVLHQRAQAHIRLIQEAERADDIMRAGADGK